MAPGTQPLPKALSKSQLTRPNIPQQRANYRHQGDIASLLEQLSHLSIRKRPRSRHHDTSSKNSTPSTKQKPLELRSNAIGTTKNPTRSTTASPVDTSPLTNLKLQRKRQKIAHHQTENAGSRKWSIFNDTQENYKALKPSVTDQKAASSAPAYRPRFIEIDGYSNFPAPLQVC